MHPNRGFAWQDEAAMLAFAGDAAFARLFAMTAAGPRVAHVPILIGPGRVLRFHLANANALMPDIEDSPLLALIEGPHAYISANWYPDQRRAVPTWNYVAVEIEGRATRMTTDELTTLLDDLAEKLEPQVGENWTRAKMDPGYFTALLGAITGFRLDISAVRGTRKLSQNKSAADIDALAAGLARADHDEMAALLDAERATRA